VDIYGRCGNYTCARHRTRVSFGCHETQEQIYKFYLAFENSLCEEYVTEKFYNALKSNMIPIVYGSADYRSIAPPNSFIDVRDFESVSKLAEYLRFLNKNPKEYIKYLEWKNDFEVLDFRTTLGRNWCDLCDKVTLERNSGWPNRKWWKDLHAWYYSTIPKQDLKKDEFNASTEIEGEFSTSAEPACTRKSILY